MAQLMSVRRIGAALRLMDSFTGQTPSGAALSVSMEDGAIPIKKADGYYIFWDNGIRHRTLLVKGRGYSDEKVGLDMEELASRRQPTYCLWLKPDRTYPYPEGIAAEERVSCPGAVECFLLEKSKGCLRLADAYPMDSLDTGLAHFLVSDGVELENRRLYIKGTNGAGEYFTVRCTENKAMGLYRLEEPLKHVYGPYESMILLTMELKADREGRMLVPSCCGKKCV